MLELNAKGLLDRAAWEEKGWLPSGWYFERYNCPRYTSPDKKGNVILDYCACVTPGNKEN